VDITPNYDARNTVYDIHKNLATMDVYNLGAMDDEHTKLPYFKFSESAQAIFNSWYESLHSLTVQTEHDNEILAEHFNKYASLMPSLALIFHLVDIVSGKQTQSGFINELNAAKAAAWCAVLETHARRIYGLGGSNELLKAHALAQKIKEHQVTDDFSLRDIYRKKWSGLQTKEDVQAAVDTLTAYEWIKPKDAQEQNLKYMINPGVYKEQDSD
jgi:hypothetical protein